MQAGPIRILEIGEFALFKRALPRSTVLLHAGGPGALSAPLADLRAYHIPDLLRAWGWIRAGMFDLIAMHANGGGAWGIPPRAALSWWLLAGMRGLGNEAPPIVALDFHDALDVHPTNVGLLQACRLYFKRELPDDHRRLFRRWASGRLSRLGASSREISVKFRPIPLGISTQIVQAIPAAWQPKTADVFFAGKIRWPEERRRGHEELRKLGAEGVRLDLPSGRLSRGEFYERCSKAWLTWSPPGIGWQCFRHDEAALCRSVPVIHESPLLEHAPLIGGEHCFYYSAANGGLSGAIREALSDKVRLERMAGAAREYVLRNHTHESVCGYILSACGVRPGGDVLSTAASGSTG